MSRILLSFLVICSSLLLIFFLIPALWNKPPVTAAIESAMNFPSKDGVRDASSQLEKVIAPGMAEKDALIKIREAGFKEYRSNIEFVEGFPIYPIADSYSLFSKNSGICLFICHEYQIIVGFSSGKVVISRAYIVAESL